MRTEDTRQLSITILYWRVMNRPIVLVHGAFHGAWCWDLVTSHLDAAGVPWRAPDLPSCADAASGAAIDEDTAAVESVLDSLPGTLPAVLLGHSRGGAVISEAGTHDRVGSLVYLTALLLEKGENPAGRIGTNLIEAMIKNVDGSFSADVPLGTELFYNDCDGDQISFATKQLRPQNIALDTRNSRQAWTEKPSIYVVCTRDKALTPDSQRSMAAQATTTLEWDTGHSPFLNRPELLAALLIGLSVGS